MAEPIYLVFLMQRKEAWYALSKAAREEVNRKLDEALNMAGAEVIAYCDASWSTEPWQYFGLVKFPDIESVRKHREATNRFHWSRYVEAISVLGIDALEEQ